MKQLTVPFLQIDFDVLPDQVSAKLDMLQRHLIDCVPWPEYNYKPAVSFSIAYTEYSICLKYYVSERFVRARYANPNDPVYKDSCVEFFISFEDEKNYYNLEFNCAGTCMAGFGKEREGRILLKENSIRLIQHQSVLKPAIVNEGNVGWELTLMIPFVVFEHHQYESMKLKRCRANFYKCGDDLPEPHFLSWNNIKSDLPDFHLPEYFGRLEFS